MDIINTFFRRFYPVDLDRTDGSQWRFRSQGMHTGWEYAGDFRQSRIFPEVLCDDGFAMSVQAHYGAYCWPRDDFSTDPYTQFEIKAADNIFAFQFFKGHEFSDGTCIYGSVPLHIVLDVIDHHGRLFDWNAADLGVAIAWTDYPNMGSEFATLKEFSPNDER